MSEEAPPTSIRDPKPVTCFQNLLSMWKNIYELLEEYVLLWTKSFLLWPLIPKICSYKQPSLTRQPRDVSRVSKPETAEEMAFKRLPTFKAKKAFGIGHFRTGQIQGFAKISWDISLTPE